MKTRLIVTMTVLMAILGIGLSSVESPNPSVALALQSRETPTDGPSPTFTHTPTTTPTATATPTKTPQAVFVPVVLKLGTGPFVSQNYSTWIDSIGVLHIAGEVSNNSGQNWGQIKVIADLFDAKGQLVGVGSSYTYITVLRPSDRTCFDIIVTHPPVGWSSLVFERPVLDVTTRQPAALAILNDSSIVSNDIFRIIGQVRNNAAERATFVQPIGTLYNEIGQVVGCDFTFVSSTNLDPGQTSSFEIDFFNLKNASAVRSYRLQVDS